MNPRISILIPLYNQERFFKACINSVCSQSYNNLEIIIVNDGSTDKSPQMARDWAARDNRVIVIEKRNEGLALARRDGYLAATGEYITFLDSDDLLAPRAIEKMANSAYATDVDLIIGGYDNWVGRMATHRRADSSRAFPIGQKIKQPDLFDKYYLNFFQSSCMFPVNVWGKLYRKCVIDKAYQETELFSHDIPFMGEDLYLNVKLFPFVRSAYRIDETVYRYRFGGGTFGYNKNFPQVFLLSEKRLELLDQYNYLKGYEPLYAEYVAHLYHHAAQLIYFKKSSKEDVINFFKTETSQRLIIPRLVKFYTENPTQRDGVQLLLNKDYDGMYYHAKYLGDCTFGSYKFKVTHFFVKLFS